MRKVFWVLLIIFPQLLVSQNKPAYKLFDKHGQAVEYNALLEQAQSSQVVLFGELHNNPIAHWLQYELTRDLHQARGQQLLLGAEMFETDNQMILDEYLRGVIVERNFRAEAKLWDNYETDYRPLVEYARQNGLPFIASNIPRRYAALVNRQGFQALEALPQQAQQLMAPLPIPYDPELPAYKAMLQMSGMPAHAGQNLPKAQAIKDATMAHFIISNLEPESILLHFHGSYHSNNYEGIVWYLEQYRPGLSMTIIGTVEQTDIQSLDEAYIGLADFILVVPSAMTKTY